MDIDIRYSLNILSSSVLILQGKPNNEPEWPFFFFKEKSFLFIYWKSQNIKINYLKLFFFNNFSKKTKKIIILNILKYKWVVKMIFFHWNIYKKNYIYTI
jgi:hypothetical protein